MSFLNVNFFSHVLGMECSANVILPQSSPEKKQKKPFKTLYLLHGASDDHTAWTRYTSIERYARDYGIAVVMPCAHLSFYTDMPGRRYFEFVSDELISIMEEMFPLSPNREDRYTAGLSMGGYGAMKLGLSCPEKFSVAASLSGALDVRELKKRTGDDGYAQLFDVSEESWQKNDLFILADKLNKSIQSNQSKPRLYIWCGTEDFLYEDNVRFKNHIEKMDFDAQYEESPGDHSWFYWDLKIKTVLEFIYKAD